jgi:predicted dehydrogenase
LIGCGWYGKCDLLQLINVEPVEVVSLCDVDSKMLKQAADLIESRQASKKRPRTYANYREMLAEKDLDIVLIATPDHWHALMGTAAARAGKHVYCEKPLSLTIAEGRRMSDVVRESGVVWQTGSQQRSDVHFRMACELVRHGRVGRLKRIRVGLASGNRDNNGCAAQVETQPVPEGLNYEMWLGPAPEAGFCPARLHSNWRWFFDYSGGNVTDFGAHHLDIVQWALGRDLSGPVRFFDLRAEWPEAGSLYTTPLTFGFSYEYEDGVRVEVADKMDFGSGISFEGEEGVITCVRGGLKIEPEGLRRPLEKTAERLYESKDHFRNFIDAVQDGVEVAAPVEVAHRSITIAHLANIGLRLGRNELRWDPAGERVLGDEEADGMRSRVMRAPWGLGLG